MIIGAKRRIGSLRFAMNLSIVFGGYAGFSKAHCEV